MGDSKQKFIGEDLLQYRRIVKMDANGSTSVKSENLEKILDAIDPFKFQENTPSAVIAITGPTEKAKFTLMNFLFDTLEGKGEKGQQQLAAIGGFDWSHSHRAGNSASIQRFLNVMEAESDQDEANSEGIFLWPEPFLVKHHDARQVVIWIMNLCTKKGTKSEELEEIIAVVCSRVMTLECYPDNIRLIVLDPYRPIPVSSDASYPEPIYLEKFCDSSTNDFRCNTLSDSTDDDNIMRNFSAAKGMNKLLKIIVNTIIEETASGVATSSETDTDGALNIRSMKEVITSAVKKSNEHRQQREKSRLMMEKSLDDASMKIEEKFPRFLKTWMRTQFNMSKKQEILELYTYLKKEVLEKFKHIATGSLWKEFNELVDARCKLELEEILKHAFKHVDMLTRLAEEQHQLLGYLPPKKLVEITKDVLTQVENFTGEGKILIPYMCKLAHEKMAVYYKEENKKILENEKKLLMQDATTHLGKVYYDEVEKYLSTASYNPQTLENLRQKLLARFSEEIKSTFKVEAQDAANGLENTKKIQEETKKAIQKMKTQYNEKVEEMLTKYPDGMDAKTLGKYHTTIVTEVKKLLQMELRHKIRQQEQLENHLKVLQDYIDKCWLTVVEVNGERLKRKKERDEKEHREKKRLEAQWELQQQQEAAARKKRGRASGEHSTDFQRSRNIEDGRILLPPLVFHLQSSRISMAMDVNGHFEMLKNESGEEQTPAFVVLTSSPESTLIYGSEAIAFFKSASSSQSEIYSWSIADFFLDTNSTWTKKLIINGHNHTITAEFLLAFLLGKLKHAAEDFKNGKYDTAVLTIPFWLPSTQRIMVKDAAKIAGFSKSYLINEASAAAFNFVHGDLRSPQGNVLVISENLDRVDVFVYAFTKYDRKVKMLAHSGNYDDGNMGSSVFTGILGRESFFRSLQETGYNDKDRTLKTRDVSHTCIAAPTLATNELGCAVRIEPDECLFICENLEKWKKNFGTVAEDFGKKAIGITEKNVVLHGAVVISRNPDEVTNYISDKLAYNVLRGLSGIHGGKIIGKNDLPAKSKENAFKLPQGHNKASIYQYNLGSQRSIGELSVKGVRSTQTLEPTLEITNEAIVNFKCAMLTSTSAGYKCLAADEQVHWKTPNLSKEKLDQFADLLKLLVTPPVVKEDSALSEARKDLLLKCQEMIERIETGQYVIISFLAKKMMLQKISVARQVADNTNSSLEGIQSQMESLQKLHDIYN